MAWGATSSDCLPDGSDQLQAFQLKLVKRGALLARRIPQDTPLTAALGSPHRIRNSKGHPFGPAGRIVSFLWVSVHASGCLASSVQDRASSPERGILARQILAPHRVLRP